MGSLKDEMRGLREDHQPCEKTDEGGYPGGSDSSAAPEGMQLNTSQESTTQEDCQPKLHVNASSVEETDKDQISKDPVLSGGDCDNNNQSDSEQVKDSTQTDDMPLIQQPEADKTATHADTTISIQLLSDGDGEIQEQSGEDKTINHDREKDADIENISVPVPSTPDPTDPRTPAPFGQHHMRTQVSLEVVQCCSAATSPMTPPEGSHSFFFPSSFGKSGSVGSDTKDAELQVGQQVEFCSVATSPMTPKTPSTTAFPELIGRETAQKEEKVKKSEEQRESGQQESFPTTKSPAEAESEISGVSKFTTSKELSEGFSSNVSPETSTNCLAAGLIDSQGTLEDSNQHCKQQRMGSMDQDITILVTHYGNNEEEDEDKVESSLCSIEPEMVKIDEHEEAGENDGDVKGEDEKEKISAETNHTRDTSNTNHPANQAEEPKTRMESETSQVKEKNEASEELRDVSVTKPPVPESPAPFGCHNIRTQVSLEVVQCQSVATSPMTPPEGDQAFCFPSSFGKCATVGTETKDTELQVGQQVEFRSVATAPMTPRTPVALTFPEVRKETSIEEKIMEEEEEEGEEDAKEQEEEDAKEQVEEDAREQVEEDAKEPVEEDAKEQVEEDAKDQVEEDAKEQVEDKEVEKVTVKENVEAAEEDKKEALNYKEKGEEKCEEPVQEVSWDEKGMTWEVYGAVVEVAVLGSAIQKHLEKQVKKQKRQSTLPPPPPLNPSATPLESAHGGGSGSGKGRAGKRGEQDGKVSRRRRNPFRQLMENMQQPHCCSRAHTTE